jgi:prepilin-type N-terminal cleavage/methylation domain-containing protein
VQSSSTSKKHTVLGFTIPELMVVIVVSGLLMSVLFGPLNELYTDNNRNLKNVVKIADTRGALRNIEHSISLSASFYNANQVTDPTGTAWAWTGYPTANPSARVLITGNYATTIDESTDTSNNRQLVYESTCNTPLINNNVYFVSNGNLYRRTIKNTAASCVGQSIGQKQTCASGYTNPNCQATDALILTNVTNFSIDYMAQADDSTAIANQYTNATVPAAAKAVVITLTAISGTGGNDTTTTSTLRVARINGS